MTESDNHLDALVAMALEEDVGAGDLTAAWFVSDTDTATARIVAMQAGVLAGHAGDHGRTWRRWENSETAAPRCLPLALAHYDANPWLIKVALEQERRAR